MEFLRAVIGSEAFTAAFVAALFSVAAAIPTIAIRLWKWLGKRLSAADLELLRAITTNAVLAVEQTMTGKAPSEAKFAKAYELASTQLAAYGVKVKPEQLRAAIEAAVALNAAKLTLPDPVKTPEAAA